MFFLDFFTANFEANTSTTEKGKQNRASSSSSIENIQLLGKDVPTYGLLRRKRELPFLSAVKIFGSRYNISLNSFGNIFSF
jgi:hypothetical protein